MQTPMGTIYSTNITPDPDTGIGATTTPTSSARFAAASHDGQPLYPAMPYASYVIASDTEIKALYAYFMGSVQPVKQDNAASTIPWPANMRWPLAWWQLLFARPRSFSPDPALDAGQQRGAELVEGLAHCGACHTRGLAFQEKAMADDGSRQFLSGSVLEGWYAKNLRNESTGLASWSEARSSTSCAPAAPIARRLSAAWPTWSSTARSTCPMPTCWRWRATSSSCRRVRDAARSGRPHRHHHRRAAQWRLPCCRFAGLRRALPGLPSRRWSRHAARLSGAGWQLDRVRR
jgi:mono/diheme cytochrome c family protein